MMECTGRDMRMTDDGGREKEKEREGEEEVENRERTSALRSQVMKNRPSRVQGISIHYLHLQLSVMKNSYMKTDPSIPPSISIAEEREQGSRAHWLGPF